MATNKQMREAIFGKLKSLFSKGKKPSKDVEKKIKSDPKLKSLWAKAEKAAAISKKVEDELAKKYGF
jgi:hypothetical protein